MDKFKQWVALTVLGCLGILTVGWFLVISPKRTEAAEVREQAVAEESTNQGLRTKLEVLKAQAKDLPKKQADLARVAAKIPGDPGLPTLIRALTAASTSAGVDLVSVTPGVPAPFVGAAPSAPATAPAPADPAAATPATAGALATIPIAINVVGGYFEVAQFMASLENLPRAFQVTNLTLVPGSSPTGTAAASTEDGSLVSSITGSVFMAANRPAATPVVAPAE